MFLVCDRIPHTFAGQSIVVGESIHALPSSMAVVQRFGRDARTRQAGAAELNGGVDLDRPRLRRLQVVSRKGNSLAAAPVTCLSILRSAACRTLSSRIC